MASHRPGLEFLFSTQPAPAAAFLRSGVRSKSDLDRGKEEFSAGEVRPRLPLLRVPLYVASAEPPRRR